jgi:hypothetical protein
MEWLNDNQGLTSTIAIVIAVIFFITERLIEARKQYRQRRNLLEAVKKEIEWDMQWCNDITEDSQEDRQRYFDPTRADFKCGNEVLVYAITQGYALLNTNENLILALVAAKEAINHYNQQTQEQHDFRFGSPEVMSKTSSYLVKDKSTLKKWMDPDKRPEGLKDFIEELRLRNWAINEGKRTVLRPYLTNALRLINEELVQSKKKIWEFWKS